MNDQIVLSLKEVSERLKRSPGSIYNLVMRRAIPYRKIGGRLGFVPEEIEKWIRDSPGLTIEEWRRENP